MDNTVTCKFGDFLFAYLILEADLT